MQQLIELLQQNLFYQLAGVILLAAIIGTIGMLLKQPLVVSFIAVGIVAGPSVLGFVHDQPNIDLLSQMGIALLLFVVGLKLDVHLIRTLGPVALATGLGQVAFTTIFGFLIALALGFSATSAIYIAIALTFSSTIIIIKLLSDKRELDSLHGRIATGFLIVQDIVVVIAMIVITAWGAGGESSAVQEIGLVVVKGVGFLAVIVLLMKYGLPQLVSKLARLPELLILFAIAWAFTLAGIGDMLGFSKEVGAFLAGVSIASTPYREAVASRLVTLRDFLLLFFFLHLGSTLNLGDLGGQVGGAVILSLFVLIGNPIIVMIIMGAMGYRRRTGFLAGLTVAQISEFSFILMALGLAIGHVTQTEVGLVTMVGILTIGISSYMIIYSHYLFNIVSPYIKIFERNVAHREEKSDLLRDGGHADAIVFGIGRFGSTILRELAESGRRVLGVDFDPEAVERCQTDTYSARFGDATDPEFVVVLPLDEAKWVVSTMPDRDVGASLIAALRSAGFKGHIAVTANDDADADWLKERGADLIVFPFREAGKEVASRIASDWESN